MNTPYPCFKKITPNGFLLNMINWHLNQLLKRYSKIQAFRIDFNYLPETSRYKENAPDRLQKDMRELTEKMMCIPGVIGHFWVIEWTNTGRIHSHCVFYLNGQKHQKSFRFIEQAGDLWTCITDQQGRHKWSHIEKYYRDDINNLVDHRDKESVHSLRRIISYLAKEEQKDGFLLWGCNEVPEPSGLGKPRTPF